MNSASSPTNRHFARGLARAFAGAVIFALPLQMTMETWWLGFAMEPARLALLTALLFPVLVLLSWHAGFESTFHWRDDVVDALVAYAVGMASAAAALGLLGLIDAAMPWREVVGKLSLLAVPGSIGALLAQTILGERTADMARGPGPRYASELFIMGVGALFLAFNLAPTDEMTIIALGLSHGQAALVMVLTVAVMHPFVYSMAFRGAHEAPGHLPAWNPFLRFTVTGYALSLLISAYLLWSFGRFDGLSALHSLQAAAVLGFPAGVGAAAARLIL